MADIPIPETQTRDIGQTVAELVQYSKDARRTQERICYDNNFFDDGYHHRFLSRTTNKIVDLSERSTVYNPNRAIPKASRQIRGVANLLLINDPTPVVYPETINLGAYPPVQQPGQIDPQTGQMGQPQMMPNPELKKAMDAAKQSALLKGHWLEEEWKEQELSEKLAFMIILAAKHGVAYMQIWADAVEEKLKTQVYDFFDIYVKGNLTSIYDSPYMIKGTPKVVAEIKANELFDKTQTAKLTPDNKLASSEIKEAYEKAKNGNPSNPDRVATIIQYEAFLKEYVNSTNRAAIQKSNPDAYGKRKDGDPIIRHAFVAGGVWLFDEYLDMVEYPFVEFRFEGGPIYQTPLINRFIPTNKSLDTVVSRVERYVHTMVTGAWLKKSGEQFKPTNVAGGQVIEYMSTPPVQANIAPIPNFVFSFMDLLNSFIEEQGVTTSALGRIPKGVRANSAIESLKESEVSSLAIPQRRLKQSVKRIAEKMLDLADEYFVAQQTVQYMEKGEPKFFDIIGASAAKKRKEAGIPADPGTVELSGDCKVDIEIEAGLGFTKQGKRQTLIDLISKVLMPLAEKGFIPQPAVKAIIQKTLETYQFGATAEVMGALDDYQNASLTDDQINAMKTALAEVFKDIQTKGGAEILPTQEQRIQENKTATIEAMHDYTKAKGDAQLQDPQAQAEIQAKMAEIDQKEETHKLKMEQLRQAIQNEDKRVNTDLHIKQVEAAQALRIKKEESDAQIKLKEKMAKTAAENPPAQPQPKK